jgi:c-di-GMP-binding flagellar brake protein YcgR
VVQKYKTKNSRQYKRLNAVYLVKYQVRGAGDQPRLTNVKNISAGGLKFVAKEFLPQEAIIKLNILVPGLERTLEAAAQVLRVRRSREGFIYSVAVKFIEISSDDQWALNQFIEDLAKDKEARLLIDHANVVVRRGKPQPSVK